MVNNLHPYAKYKNIFNTYDFVHYGAITDAAF